MTTVAEEIKEMDDLISRKAAIDTVRRCLVKEVTPAYRLIDKADVITELTMLPSAEQEIIKCKNCKHRIINENYGKKGYMNLKAMCDLDSGDPFELSRCAENDEWFCADAERRTDG